MSGATIEAQLGGRPIGALQYRVFIFSFLVIFFDGFDTQVISYVAPMIAKQWRLAPGAMGPVFSAGLFGLMLGALFFAPLADRFGRRRTIIPATLAFAILSLATVLATSLPALGLIRFLTGLALGAALINAVALATDYSPPARRGAVTMIVTSGMSLGSITSGLLTARLGPTLGWRAIFLIGGALPFVLALVMIAVLPESIAMLMRHGDGPARAHALLARTLGEEPAAIVVDAASDRATVGALFAEHLRRITPLLWLAFGVTMLALYLIVNWLPTILTSVGFSAPAAAATTTFYHIGAVVGTYTLALLIDRFRPRTAVLIASAVGVASLLAYALGMQTAGGWTRYYLFGIGFGMVGCQIALIALTSATYPGRLRATGLGWGLGIGRIGSIIGPLLGGIMIARGITPEAMLLLCMGAMVVTALATAAMPRRGSST